MEKRAGPQRFVDTLPEFQRSVVTVDTDPGEDVPHVTLACGHGIYLLAETLTETQRRSGEPRFCSQCLNEYLVSLQHRAAS